MKDIIETDECRVFYDGMTDGEKAEYENIYVRLARDGRLSAPYGEKWWTR